MTYELQSLHQVKQLWVLKVYETSDAQDGSLTPTASAEPPNASGKKHAYDHSAPSS